MKNHTKIIALLAVMVISSLGLSLMGCGDSPTSLEEYLEENPEQQETIDSIESSLGDGGSVEITGNNIIMTYAYDETYEGDTLDLMEETIDSTLDSMESTFQDTVDTLKEESGFEDISLEVIFENGDGTEIASEVYE